MNTWWDLVRDILSLFFIIGGVFFMAVGAFGVFRFPDAYHRLHALSKTTTLGILGLLLGAMFHVGSLAVVTKGIVTMIFALVASPVGSHVLAKAAHINGMKQWPGTLGDELAEDKLKGIAGETQPKEATGNNTAGSPA